jgi:hypothetical protein
LREPPAFRDPPALRPLLVFRDPLDLRELPDFELLLRPLLVVRDALDLRELLDFELLLRPLLVFRDPLDLRELPDFELLLRPLLVFRDPLDLLELLDFDPLLRPLLAFRDPLLRVLLVLLELRDLVLFVFRLLDDAFFVVDFFRDPPDEAWCARCPFSPCSFITVRAATSLARFPYRPSSFALSRMCSYCRCSFADAPRRCFFPGMASPFAVCRAYAADVHAG